MVLPEIIRANLQRTSASRNNPGSDSSLHYRIQINGSYQRKSAMLSYGYQQGKCIDATDFLPNISYTPYYFAIQRMHLIRHDPLVFEQKRDDHSSECKKFLSV